MKHVSILSSALGLAFALHAASAAAAVPATSAVEGTLQAAGGGAAADGVYAITFGLYNKEVGGNPLWVEGPINIGVKSGQWSHALGTKSALSPSVVNGASVWLGVQIGSDPELPRQPLASTAFAVRAAVAEALECSGCVGAGAIDPKVFESMVKKSDLAAVALSGNFSDLKGGPDLSAYAKTAALAAVATSGNYSDLKGAPDLAPYAKAAALAAVAQSGSYNDLKDKPAISDAGKTGNYGDLQNKPVLPQLGKSCGTGLVMAGIKADGSYDCSVSAIAPDMIDEVSNGLIWNQFVDSTNGGVKVPIPDGNGAGKSDSLDFPDIGSAQAIWVNVDILTSDLSAVTIELYGPGMATPYVLYAKGKTGNTLKAAFNKDTPIAQGDMNKDWIGKNPKGLWSLIVKDPLKNQMPPAVNDGEFTWSLAIQTLSTKKIQVKGNLIVDGSVKVGTDSATCDATKAGTMRYNSADKSLDLCNGTAWVAWFGTGGFPNSAIITPTYASMINGWIGNPFKTWKLCYKKSVDAGDSGTFHSKCNGKGDTVTVAKLDNGRVIGGYAGCSWYSKNDYRYTCGGSFVFSLTLGHKFNKKFYHVDNGNNFSYLYWIYDHSGYGPTFGGGHDWHVSSNMTTGYCNLGHDYTCRVGTNNSYSGYGDTACRNDFCGSYDSWKITELEVWYPSDL